MSEYQEKKYKGFVICITKDEPNSRWPFSYSVKDTEGNIYSDIYNKTTFYSLRDAKNIINHPTLRRNYEANYE